MNREDLRSAVYESISAIAPGIELSTMDPGVDLREEMDLDSRDMLNLIIALHKRLNVDLPEIDVPLLTTLECTGDYVVAKFNAPT